MARRSRDFPTGVEPLPVALVDNHTHLDAIGGVLHDGVADPGVDGQLRWAASVGVTELVQIGCDLASAPWSIAVAEEHPQVLAGVAIHPNEAVLHAGVREVAEDGLEPEPLPRHETSLTEAMAQVAELAQHPRVRVIGESGLDYFRAGPQGRAAQREAFRAHIALAKEMDLPLQIHDRQAHQDVLDILAADGAPERTVFHCFSGDSAMAAECVRRGYYLSFAGTATFRNAKDVRTAAVETPSSHLMVETDAPFLTPHPWRGQPNAPYVAAATARWLAEERGEDLEGFCRTVTATSHAVYGPW